MGLGWVVGWQRGVRVIAKRSRGGGGEERGGKVGREKVMHEEGGGRRG